MNLTPLTVAFHRNGMDGAPFHALLFRDHESPESVMLGILFDQPGYTAVLDVAKLADHDVAFGSNSWRGDVYEPHLRRLIAEHGTAEAAAFDGAGRV